MHVSLSVPSVAYAAAAGFRLDRALAGVSVVLAGVRELIPARRCLMLLSLSLAAKFATFAPVSLCFAGCAEWLCLWRVRRPCGRDSTADAHWH